jgi:hypothetical protein
MSSAQELFPPQATRHITARKSVSTSKWVCFCSNRSWPDASDTVINAFVPPGTMSDSQALAVEKSLILALRERV